MDGLFFLKAVMRNMGMLKNKLLFTAIISVLLLSINIDIALAGQFSKKIGEIANYIGGSFSGRSQRVRIAVVDFEEMDSKVRNKNLGRKISDALSTKLVQTRKFDVLERVMIDKAFEELKFDMRDVVDQESAQRAGKILGAEAIVYGTVSDDVNFYTIDAKMMAVETGLILVARTVKVSWTDVTNLGAGIRSAVIPGWGQFYKKHRTKGWLFLTSESLLIPTALYTIWISNDEHQKALNSRRQADRNYHNDRSDLFWNISLAAWIAAGGLYVYNIFDAGMTPEAKVYSRRDVQQEDDRLVFYIEKDLLALIYERHF